MNYQVGKEIAKPAALDILKKKFTQEESKATDQWYRQRFDYQDAAKNAKKFKSDYERVVPETLSVQVINQLWKRAKQLKDEFTFGMLAHEELHPTKPFLQNGTTKYVVDEEKMRTNRSAEREQIWQKQNNLKIQEFKNIMRHLNPQDSNAGDVERFRPKRRKV